MTISDAASLAAADVDSKIISIKKALRGCFEAMIHRDTVDFGHNTGSNGTTLRGIGMEKNIYLVPGNIIIYVSHCLHFSSTQRLREFTLSDLRQYS